MSMHYPTVWAFGDSITQRNFDPDKGCWGALVANSLVRKCDFIQRGFDGYTTQNYKPMLPNLFTKDDVKLCKAITILLGTNDSSRRRVPKEEYVANLKEFISYFTSLGVPANKILMLTPPPNCTTDKDRAGITAEYAAACLDVAKGQGCPCVDLNTEMSKENNLHELFLDGVHFNRQGANACFALVQPALQKLLGDIPTIGEIVEQQ